MGQLEEVKIEDLLDLGVLLQVVWDIQILYLELVLIQVLMQ